MLSRSLFWEFATSLSVLTVSQGLQEGARRVLQAPSSCSIQGRAFPGISKKETRGFGTDLWDFGI